MSNNLPYIVSRRLEDFQPYEKEAYFERYQKKQKSLFTGYLLLIILGCHYSYLGNWRNQILCWITFWGLLLWWFVDWFRLPGLIRSYNEDLACELLKEFSWVQQKKINNITSQKDNNFSQWKKSNPTGTLNDYYKSNRR